MDFWECLERRRAKKKKIFKWENAVDELMCNWDEWTRPIITFAVVLLDAVFHIKWSVFNA